MKKLVINLEEGSEEKESAELPFAGNKERNAVALELSEEGKTSLSEAISDPKSWDMTSNMGQLF